MAYLMGVEHDVKGFMHAFNKKVTDADLVAQQAVCDRERDAYRNKKGKRSSKRWDDAVYKLGEMTEMMLFQRSHK
jgi:hypothetical protein